MLDPPWPQCPETRPAAPRILDIRLHPDDPPDLAAISHSAGMIRQRASRPSRIHHPALRRVASAARSDRRRGHGGGVRGHLIAHVRSPSTTRAAHGRGWCAIAHAPPRFRPLLLRASGSRVARKRAPHRLGRWGARVARQKKPGSAHMQVQKLIWCWRRMMVASPSPSSASHSDTASCSLLSWPLR